MRILHGRTFLTHFLRIFIRTYFLRSWTSRVLYFLCSLQCSANVPPPGLLSLLSRCNDLGHATDDAHALAAGLHGFCGGVAALTPETRELFHQMAGQSLVRSGPVSASSGTDPQTRSEKLACSTLVARPTRICCEN